jgi:hypothetical protein
MEIVVVYADEITVNGNAVSMGPAVAANWAATEIRTPTE